VRTLEAAPQNRYRPRAANVIQRLFRERFPAFELAYEERYVQTNEKLIEYCIVMTHRGQKAATKSLTCGAARPSPNGRNVIIGSCNSLIIDIHEPAFIIW
jgi:hypothetical protein